MDKVEREHRKASLVLSIEDLESSCESNKTEDLKSREDPSLFPTVSRGNVFMLKELGGGESKSSDWTRCPFFFF